MTGIKSPMAGIIKFSYYENMRSFLLTPNYSNEESEKRRNGTKKVQAYLDIVLF
jgi:hypothetical protein